MLQIFEDAAAPGSARRRKATPKQRTRKRRTPKRGALTPRGNAGMGTHPGAAPGAVVTLDKAKRLHQRATTPLKTNSTKDAKHTSASSASSQASDSASSASILPKKSSPSPSQEGQTPEAGQIAISTPSDAATARRRAIIMRAKMRSKSSKQKEKVLHTVAKSKANSRNAKDDLRRQALINTTAPIAGGIDLRELRQRLETMKIASKSSAEKQGNITEDRSTAKISNPESEKPLPDNQCTLADSINASHVSLCTSSGQSQDSEAKKSGEILTGRSGRCGGRKSNEGFGRSGREWCQCTVEDKYSTT